MHIHRACCLIYLVSIIAVTGEVPTDQCVDEREHHCGDNLCCCTKTKARCEFLGDRLQYIPKLPSTIKEVHFNSNRLPKLTKETIEYANILNITTLVLTNNNIRDVGSDTFTILPFLTVLDVSGNVNVNKTSMGYAFGGLQKNIPLSMTLTNVSLCNDLDTVFRHMNGSPVKYIDLSRNRIEELNLNTFSGFQNLQKLNIGNSNIEKVSITETFLALNYILLNDNRIFISLPRFCPQDSPHRLLPNLRHIDLSNNYIEVLEKGQFDCLLRLEYLSLSGNLITHFPANVFSKLNGLQNLQLTHMKVRVNSIEKYAFNSSSLLILNLAGGHIRFTPKLASDIFQGCGNLTRLILDHNDLGKLGEEHLLEMFHTLTRLEYLVLISVSLDRFPRTFFAHFPNLLRLSLDGNSIRNLEHMFDNVTSLQTLDLQTNKISVLTQKSFPDNLLASLREINLSDNPFSCTCENLWFRSNITNNRMIGKTKLVSFPYRYKCATPETMKGKRFDTYHPTEESCRQPTDNTRVVKIVTFTVGGIVLTSMLVSIIVYRYRWYIRYWMYKYKHSNTDPEQQSLLSSSDSYDGYVINSDEDNQFVHGDLLNLVEYQQHNKLYIWHRDADCGAKIDVMADALYSSKNVLVILSSNFLRDSWCKFQLEVALDRQVDLKRDFVMLITLDNIDYKSLSTYWCVVLTKYKVVEWCSSHTDIKRRVLEQALVNHFK